MADLLTLSAVKKVEKKVANININGFEYSDSILHSGCQLCLTSGNACCWCIPDTANNVRIEMWGQGGGGGGACCCMWGMYGGRGGDYANKRLDVSAMAEITFCGCVCQCSCQAPNCCGHIGQCARLTDCTNTETYITMGGDGGKTCCYYQMCMGCPECNVHLGLGNTGLNVDSNKNLYNSGDVNANTFLTQRDSVVTEEAVTVDTVYEKVPTCTQFDLYRRGGCGYSCCASCCGYANHGIGGSSYAGGAEQRHVCTTTPANCGWCGNFPGGGGHSSGACGGGSCIGGRGGYGLILISWD